MVTLFNVISQDGFIARKDGSEDFIPDTLWSETLEFFSRYDTLVIGRKTYEAMQQYEQALLIPFEHLPIKKVVVTRDQAFMPKEGYSVAHSAEEGFAMGSNVLVSSGPGLNIEILAKGLADKIVLMKLPTSIGEGIEPFPRGVYGDSSLAVEYTHSFV